MSIGKSGRRCAGVVFFRRNLPGLPMAEFMGDGQPARYIGTVVFDLAAPPFKHRTSDRETLSRKMDPQAICLLVPSRETLCYLVPPRHDAIAGAIREHLGEQRLESDGWTALVSAVRRIMS